MGELLTPDDLAASFFFYKNVMKILPEIKDPNLNYGEEVGVFHGLHGGEPLLMVVPEQLVQKVKGLGAD